MSEGQPIIEMRGVVKKYEKGLIPLGGRDAAEGDCRVRWRDG